MLELTHIRKFVVALWRRQEGQGLVEYSLLLVLIAIAAMAALIAIQGDISHQLSSIGLHL